MEGYVVVILDETCWPERAEVFDTQAEAEAFCFGYGEGAGDYGGFGTAVTGDDLAREIGLASADDPEREAAFRSMISKAKRK